MTFSSANLINFDFVKWELALLAFAVLIAVFIWRGKGIKSAIIFLLVAIALIGVALFTKYFSLPDDTHPPRSSVPMAPRATAPRRISLAIFVMVRYFFTRICWYDSQS